MLQAVVGNRGVPQVEAVEVLESRKRLQARIRQVRATDKLQCLDLFQTANGLHAPFIEIRAAQIQKPQTDQLSQVGLVNIRLRHPTPKQILDALQPSQIPQVPSGLHQLRVHAVEKTWLRVVIDGEQTKDMMLSPDQQVQWEARSNFTLTVGNAGGIEVALDGNPLPPLGRSGEVVRRVRIPSVE